MNKFIEITYKDNDRFLLNTELLLLVDENNINGGPVLIAIRNEKNGKIGYYSVKESFDEIIELLKK